MSKTIKIIIGAVVVLILLLVAFNYFKGSSSNSSSQGDLSSAVQTGSTPTTADASTDSSGIGNTFLQTLLNLSSIKIDSSLFTSDTFNALQDFTVVLTPPTNVGRPDPFAPTTSTNGSSSTAATSATATSSSTATN